MARTISLWHKTIWRLARTPAAGLIKALHRARVRPEINHRRALAQQVPKDSRFTALARDFRRDGYCRLDDVVDAGLLAAAGTAAQKKYARATQAAASQESTHKDFWTRLLDEDKVDGMLPANNPFVSFALQPAVLGVLTEVYGELPLLDDVLLVLSRPTGKKLTSSQLWHHDYDDLRTVKLYIYLTDVVSVEDGPFTFLPVPASSRLGGSWRSRRSDEEIAARVPAEAIVRMTAPRLSVFMVETSRCLHMGSRVADGHERLMYMASYISIPRVYPEPAPRFHLNGNESELVRCVLSPKGNRI